MGGHDYAARRADDHDPGRAGTFERHLIRARTGEGRKRAQDRGVKFGRPRKLTARVNTRQSAGVAL